MSDTKPVRIDLTLTEAAETEATTMGRTLSAQITHWARLGRAIEEAGIKTTAVHRALSGSLNFDDLDDEDQNTVASMWDHDISGRIDGLNFAEEFEASGESYTELDDDGNVIERGEGDGRQVVLVDQERLMILVSSMPRDDDFGGAMRRQLSTLVNLECTVTPPITGTALPGRSAVHIEKGKLGLPIVLGTGKVLGGRRGHLRRPSSDPMAEDGGTCGVILYQQADPEE